MCAPLLMQIPDECLLVSQMEKHWPLLLLGTNSFLILLTFDYYFFGVLYIFMAVFVSQVLELLLPTKKFHFSLSFYFFYFSLLWLLLILHCFSLHTLSRLNSNFSIKLSQGRTSVLCRTQPQTTEIWTPGPWVWVQFTEKRWQWLSMSEFLFNYTDLLYPLSLVGMNVEWSGLPGGVSLLDAMTNEFTTWRTPWCFSDGARMKWTAESDCHSSWDDLDLYTDTKFT